VLVLVAVLPRDHHHHRSYQPQEPRVWAMRTSMSMYVLTCGYAGTFFSIHNFFSKRICCVWYLSISTQRPRACCVIRSFPTIAQQKLSEHCVLTKLGVISLLDSHITAVVPISSQVYCTPRPSSLALAQA
jgi:hypothetical protein